MAEVAGLALAVPAVVGTALKFADYLYRYYKDIDAADRDIVAFSFDVRSFATTTKYGFTSLDRICRTLREANSPVVEYLQSEGILHDLASKCWRTRRQVKSAWDYTDSAQSRIGFVARWKWVNCKSDVMALRTHMESLKTSLILVVSIMTLESSLKHLPDTASQAEIEEQRAIIGQMEDQIKDHVKTIARLQEYESVNLNSNAQAVHSLPYSRLPEALVELGTSMAEEGQIPYHTKRSLSSMGNSSGRKASYVSDITTSTAPTTPSITKSQPSITQIKLPRRVFAVPPAKRRSTSSQLQTLHQLPSGEDNRVQSSQSQSYIAGLRRKQQRMVTLPAPPDQVSSEVEVSASQLEQAHHTAVIPNSNYLQHFNASGNMQSISGYIVANAQLIHATANVDPECPQNLISDAFAARLHLNIQPHDSTDGDESAEVTISFPNGEVRKSSGEVIFQWSAGAVASHRRPFNVRCLVYEHGIRNLVLGRPFLDRKNRYWHDGEGDSGPTGK